MCNSAINYEAGHDYIDLGLSVKWASCNIGGETPYDYGHRYAWGKTEQIISLENYDRWGARSIIDGRTRLNPEEDVAHVTWQGRWRLPTMEEFRELIDNCQFELEENGDVFGVRFTSSKRRFEGNSIFLRASGLFEIDDNGLYEYGMYWAADLYMKESSLSQKASILTFEKGLTGRGDVYIIGLRPNDWANVRPVFS